MRVWGHPVSKTVSAILAGGNGNNGGAAMADVATRADVPEHLRSRVDRMFSRDAGAAIVLTIVLWLTILFVILEVRPYMPRGVEPVCWISAAILLLDNTASIVAMLRHYAEDKAHIYPIDIQHLDARR